MQKYSKLIAALAAAAGVAVSTSADNEFSLNDTMSIVAALFGALLVYAVPNKP